MAQKGGARVVKGPLHNALEHPAPGPLVREGRDGGPADRPALRPAIAQLRRSGGPARPRGQGEACEVLSLLRRRVRLDRPLVGKERQEHLLHGIFVVVAL